MKTVWIDDNDKPKPDEVVINGTTDTRRPLGQSIMKAPCYKG